MRIAGLVRIAGVVIVGGAALAATVGIAPRRAHRAPLTPPAPHHAAPPAAAPHPQPARTAAIPADTPFVVKRILRLDAPLRHGDYAWDDAGVPQGPLLITVDIAAETISVFRDGYEIGAAGIVFGADDKPTPLGTFTISQKDAHHVSNLYDAPMPYMLRLTNDGVAIHGSMVAWDAATRGCIGVPTPFARLLFAQARLGDRVIITKGRVVGMGAALAT